MTEAEARALPIGAPISDYGPGVGTVVEKHLDSLVIKWTAPPTRVEGVSTFMYDELSRWPAPVAGNAIFYPGVPSGGPPNSMANTPLVLGTSFVSSVAASITKVHFYRDATDTDVSHVATVWRLSDQAKLGQATFPAGSPTGWQSVAIGPIAMALGVTYVVTVTHATGGYQFLWPFANDAVNGTLTLSKVGRYQASSDPNVFPTNTIDGYYYGIDITTVPAAATASIWTNADIPGAIGNDAQPVTAGTKFEVLVPCNLVGARFYKDATVTGTHKATVWRADTPGTPLAVGNFTGETASGWQTMAFGSPVALVPGVLYAVGIYSPAGYYAFTGNYFTAAHGNAVVSAPGNLMGTWGTNQGTFFYGDGFPTQPGGGANFWADVIVQ